MEAKGKEEEDLEMKIIGLLQELTDLCSTMVKTQSKIVKMQVMILDQLSVITIQDLYQDYGGNC